MKDHNVTLDVSMSVMKDPDGLCDVHPADGAGVPPVQQHLAAVQAGDHVAARPQQAVPLTVHADGAVTVKVAWNHRLRWGFGKLNVTYV